MRTEPFESWIYVGADYLDVYANGKLYELLVSRKQDGRVLVTAARHAKFTLEYTCEQDFLQDWQSNGGNSQRS